MDLELIQTARAHTSPFYRILVACAGIPLPSDLFVEDRYYLERIEHVDYLQPSSSQLGETVRAKARCQCASQLQEIVGVFP